jgi:8-oxo-dGTP diphosphatase
VDLETGPLCALGWNPPRQPGRNARFSFVFDMEPTIPMLCRPGFACRRASWTPGSEAHPDKALGVLHPDMAERLTVARDTPPSAVYIETSGRP